MTRNDRQQVKRALRTAREHGSMQIFDISGATEDEPDPHLVAPTQWPADGDGAEILDTMNQVLGNVVDDVYTAFVIAHERDMVDAGEEPLIRGRSRQLANRPSSPPCRR